MGLEEETNEIKAYALSKDWDQNVFVQVFEVNIRILGRFAGHLRSLPR